MTNANFYSGTTTITSATLQLDNGGSNGYVNGPIVDNGAAGTGPRRHQSFAFQRHQRQRQSRQIGSGMSTLNAANTFSGNTTIGAGTLQLDNSLALQNSTLVYNNQGGVLSFIGGLTSATLGGLSGSQSLPLLDVNGGPVALTVGGNGQSTTYSGTVGRKRGLIADQSRHRVADADGQQQHQRWTANELEQRRRRRRQPRAPRGIVAQRRIHHQLRHRTAKPGQRQRRHSQCERRIDFNAGSGSAQSGNGGLLVSSGLANLTGGLNISLDNSTAAANSIAKITGGTVNSGSITIRHNATASYSTAKFSDNRSWPDGRLDERRDSTSLAALDRGREHQRGNPNTSTNSTANFRMDGGTVNVSGPIQIGLNNTGRWSIANVNGGSLVDSDTTSGIQIGNPSAGNAEFLVRARVSPTCSWSRSAKAAWPTQSP